MSGVAVVTDSTTYLPPSLIERWGVQQVSLYVGWGDERLPEPEYELDAFYARLRDSRRSPIDLPALGGRLPRLLRTARRSRPRHRLRAHRRRPLGYLRERPGGGAGRRRQRATRPGRGRRRPDRRRRARLPGPRPPPVPPSRARRLDDVVEAIHRTRAGPRHVVLPRHARVPAARRAHRRGAGPGRDGAENQADPHLRHGDRPGRSRPHPAARPAEDDRLPARAPRARRREWFVQHAQSPEDAATLVAEGTAIFGTPSRSSAPRSGRCSALTSAPGCWSAARAARRR